MLYGMYVSAAGALANSHRQDVIANNLANAETVAFKRDLAMFQTRRTASAEKGDRRFTAPMLEGIGGGVFALPTHTDFAPAALEQTDDRLDFGLGGAGFFRVQNGAAINYTRDGRFAFNEKNELVTRTGHLPVLDEQGQAIVMEPSVRFTVNAAGVVSQEGSEVAQLSLVDFKDTGALRKQGDNLYSATPGADTLPVRTAVKQGYLESSGVSAVEAMTQLIETARRFQANLTLVQMQDQTLGAAVSRLGSIS